MVPLLSLWLPILLSAVGVFIVSGILHMALKFWHLPDYQGFANDDEVRDAIRRGNPSTPGMYTLPFCKMEDMNKPETAEKFKQGPVGMIFLRPNGMPGMGASLGQWFIACLLVASICAHLAASTLAPGASSHLVFHVTGLIAFLAYAFGSIPAGIWYGQPWKTVIKDIIDGLIYGLITGGVFAWCWP